MVIEKVEKGRSGIAKLVGEGHSLFVRLVFWEALGRDEGRLGQGVELDEDESVDLAIAAQATEAEARGASLLGRAEQPRYLLRIKLLEKGYADRATALALGRLEEEGLLSDRRYAAAWLRARVDRMLRSAQGGPRPGGPRAEGPSSLLVSLRSRGVDESTAKAALAEVLDSDTRKSLLDATISLISAAAGKGRRSESEGLRAELRGLGWKGEEIREAIEGRGFSA
ncbi:MAG TPA: hypothetical protein VMV44_10545 [Rectinemataceae bacterium]|nr:hypothetical protein [Rectinemataceae bacterium]